MKFTFYSKIEDFGADTIEILMENEVQNNLPISFIRNEHNSDTSKWILTSVKDENGSVVLTAACTPPFNIVMYETKSISELFCISEISGSDTFVKIEPINKGFSRDKKYYIETADGRRMPLRVTDISELDRKKAEYKMMERAYAFGVLTPRLLDFGLCNCGRVCYSLLIWFDGEDVEAVLPRMSESEQYGLGIKAGELLRRLHSLSAPADAEPWGMRFRRKIQDQTDFFSHNPIQSESGDILLHYLLDNQTLLDGRPQTFNQGDFHPSNLILTHDGKVGVIDYNPHFLDHGDPWWEFRSCSWGVESNAHFYTGRIVGYFNGDPPLDFFKMQAYYDAYSGLSTLRAASGEQREPEEGRRHLENVLRWFDNMQSPIPTWYLKDFYIQWIDGVPYKLEAPFDFSFISKYGKVFKAFDEQGSGNISFGMKNGDMKYFIKFAGAPKPNYISNRDSGAVDAARKACNGVLQN